MDTRTIDHNGASLFYRIKGEGHCMVLLHGFGEDGRVWHNQWDHFPGYRLLIPDLPGSGRSQPGQSGSMEALADAVHTLLLQENITRCVLIGHSMGGYVALAFLERYPELLVGLGLFHSTAFADSSEKKATREKGIAFMEKLGAGLFLASTTPNLFAPATQTGDPALIGQVTSQMQDARTDVMIAYYQGMMARPDRTYLLRNRSFPILFVLGKYDAAVPLADGLQQAHLPQWAAVHLLHKSGHMGMMEEPEECNKLLQEYMAIVSSP